MGSKKDKTYDEFAKSQYYSAFVKFGRYILDIRAVNPESYIRYLTTNKVKLDWWCKDSTYNKYLAEQSKTETPERAVERFVLLAQDWSQNTGNHWSDYFVVAPHHVIVQHIELGRKRKKRKKSGVVAGIYYFSPNFCSSIILYH